MLSHSFQYVFSLRVLSLVVAGLSNHARGGLVVVVEVVVLVVVREC
jgi:hypothetical protein